MEYIYLRKQLTKKTAYVFGLNLSHKIVDPTVNLINSPLLQILVQSIQSDFYFIQLVRNQLDSEIELVSSVMHSTT